jgi:3-isopropylmalate/(R)-2-methylmalate dehydratase large subunit
MGNTIIEKIIAKKCGKSVKPGEIVNIDVDLIICNDITTTSAIRFMDSKGIKHVCDPSRIVAVPDHFAPNKDIKSAEMIKIFREWANKQGIKYFKVGNHGVEHALFPEQGYIKPGMVIVGADSHTCTHGAMGAFSVGIGSTDLAAVLTTGKLWFKVPETIKVVVKGKIPQHVYSKDIILEVIRRIGVDGALYKVIEFSGESIDELSVEARMTICNMAIEAGGKAGVINPDFKTIEYVKSRTNDEFEIIKSDEDANYSDVIEIDISGMEPIVAFPHIPSNGKPISEAKGIKVDQAFLGGCTNARIEDLRIAAEVMKGKKVAENTRMIVVPATTEIWKQANSEGLLDIFMEAGATISTPSCAACWGGYMGILAAGEKGITSTNRNFVGRMGSPKSEVYLASPATVAASAIKGEITHPKEVV